MGPIVLPLHDQARGRLLPTTVYAPVSGTRAPLIVFGHGMWGHPRKFRRLFARWLEAGYVVAAPAFPHTNDENPPPYLIDDVANQPADISFVLDELLARGVGEADRIGVGGYSLGAETALAVGLHPRYADRRVRAVVAVAGALSHPEFAADVLRPLPLLLVHGAEDTKKDRLREALKVYETAREPKELVTIDGAGHGICEDDGPAARDESGRADHRLLGPSPPALTAAGCCRAGRRRVDRPCRTNARLPQQNSVTPLLGSDVLPARSTALTVNVFAPPSVA